MPDIIAGKVVFTVEDLIPLVDANGIVDCTKGGLILGNSHADGGIKVIRQWKKDLYEIAFEFEGFEYIMHPDATEKHLEYLTNLNNEFQQVSNLKFESYDITKNITVLDTRPIIEDIKVTNRF